MLNHDIFVIWAASDVQVRCLLGQKYRERDLVSDQATPNLFLNMICTYTCFGLNKNT